MCRHLYREHQILSAQLAIPKMYLLVFVRFKVNCQCFFFFVSYFTLAIPCKPPDITTKEIQLPKERKNRYHSGETISFGCKVGYKGIGNATRQCNEGHWTTKNFYCESKLSLLTIQTSVSVAEWRIRASTVSFQRFLSAAAKHDSPQDHHPAWDLSFPLFDSTELFVV